jgi:hypothetical protein
MANVINFNDENKDTQQQINQTVSGAISPLITPTAAPAQSVTSPTKPASSGQFTNIQQYLKANKGAGEQIAGNVQEKMEKTLQPGISQQAGEAEKFRAGAEKAQQTFGRGQEYLTQLGSASPQPMAQQPNTTQPSGELSTGAIQNSGVLTKEQAIDPANRPAVTQQTIDEKQKSFQKSLPEFLADQNKLVDYTKIRTGQAVDEQELKRQAEQSQLTAGLGQQKAGELFGRTKSAVGRQGLLSETFNRPTYTQGQQRLDNLFLTGAGQKGVGAIQQGAKADVARAGDIYSKATKDVGSLSGISEQNKAISEGLQGRASELEKGYLTNLESLIPEVNTMRGAEKERWQKNFDILTGKAKGTIDQDIYDELQLRTGERAYNVFNNPELNLRQISQVSDRSAQNAQDVASQSDVDYYKKLAQLSKGAIGAEGQFVAPTEDQLLLSKASDLGRAVKSNVGENSLRGMLDQAGKNFDEFAKKTNVVGQGQDTGSSSILGGGGTASSSAAANLADYLKSRGVNTSTVSTDPNANNLIKAGAAMGNPMALLSGASPLLSSMAGTASQLAGASGGSGAAANFWAQRNLLAQVHNALQGQGFGNFIGTKGLVGTKDLQGQQLHTDSVGMQSLLAETTPLEINEDRVMAAAQQLKSQKEGGQVTPIEYPIEMYAQEAKAEMEAENARRQQRRINEMPVYGQQLDQRNAELRSRLGMAAGDPNAPSIFSSYNVDDLMRSLLPQLAGK